MTGRVIAQRYQILDTIGKGGMAIVYRAIDNRTGHSVAIKVLRPEFSQDEEFLSRFQREAEAASKVSHHNIVNLLDVGMDGESRYLVMEYVQGKTLKEVIRSKGKLPYATACQIAIRILSALQHTHRNGIIHRDIKPQNILVQSEGHIKVADFGIARMANSSTLTKGDSVMGSVHYFSPEQAAGENVAETSDIYSVGVVMYEMLTGQVPFDGDSPVAVAMQHLHNTPKSIAELSPDVPAAIAHVVMVAMEKEPRYRYQTALEMATDLKKALEGKTDLQEQRSESQPILPLTSQGTGPVKKSVRSDTARRKTAQQQKMKLRQRIRKIFRLSITILMAGLVFFGLYLGGMEIYTRLSSSRTAPDLVGKDEQTARALIQRADLKVEIRYIHHPSILLGTVIQQTPEYDTEMRKYDTIALVISSGPDPDAQLMPSVKGKLSDDAQLTLQNLGIAMDVTKAEWSAEPENTILEQFPSPGEPYTPGDTLQVTVSRGSPFVPDLSKLTLEEAKDALAQNGLMVDEILKKETTEVSMNGKVVDQYPIAGTQVIPGTLVKMTVADSESRRHKAVITLKMPKDTSVHVSVKLVDLNGVETEKYAATHAADSDPNPQVVLYSSMPGVMTYKVYFDGVFSYEDKVTLN